MSVNCTDPILEKKRNIYTNQINKTIERLKNVLETIDQDYINTYIMKVLETSFHRLYLPQKDIPIVANILNKLIKYDREPKNETEEKKRDWNYALDHLLNFTIDICSICDAKLHSQGRFPKGYPDKWKLCCRHRDTLINGMELENSSAMYGEDFEKYKEKYEELFSLKW